MAIAESFWMRRPVFGAMRYMGESDLPDLRAWVATLDTTASEQVVTRIDPLGYDGGFQMYQAWIFDPGSEFLGPRGFPGEWVLNYYGQIQVQSEEQFTRDYEPVDPAAELPPEPDPEPEATE